MLADRNKETSVINVLGQLAMFPLPQFSMLQCHKTELSYQQNSFIQ